MYRPGFGFSSLFHSFFTEGFLRETPCEIWTGVFNRTISKQQLFSNRSKGSTLIDPYATTSTKGVRLNVSVDPIYTNGDRVLLAKAALASASMPLFLLPVKIGTEEYSDGGSSGSSPLSV